MFSHEISYERSDADVPIKEELILFIAECTVRWGHELLKISFDSKVHARRFVCDRITWYCSGYLNIFHRMGYRKRNAMQQSFGPSSNRLISFTYLWKVTHTILPLLLRLFHQKPTTKGYLVGFWCSFAIIRIIRIFVCDRMHLLSFNNCNIKQTIDLLSAL